MDIGTAELIAAARVLERFEGRDTGSLTDHELVEYVLAGDRVAHLGGTHRAVAAHEMEVRSDSSLGERSFARRHGQRTAQHLIARLTGMNAGAAARVLEVGRMLAKASSAGPAETTDMPVESAVSETGGEATGGDTPDAGAETSPTPPGGAATSTAAVPAPAPVPAPTPNVRGAADGVYRRVASATARGAISGDLSHLITRTLNEVRALRSALSQAREIGGTGAPTHRSATWTEPDALEALLVRLAIESTPTDLRRKCLAARAAADPVAWEARERRHHEERFLIVNAEEDGTVTLRGRLDATSAAPLVTFLDAQVRAAMQKRRALPRSADPRGAGAMRLDALVDLAKHGLGCSEQATGVTTTVMVRVAKAELEAGVGLADCDGLLAPVSIGALRRMAVDLAVLPAVLGSKGQVLDLGRTERLFTPAQRLAIGERDGGCAMCGAPPSWCATHHIEWWTCGGRTDLANGVLLCTNCHHRVHDGTWDIVPRDGEIYIRPPAAIDPTRKLRPAVRRRVKQPGATAA